MPKDGMEITSSIDEGGALGEKARKRGSRKNGRSEYKLGIISAARRFEAISVFVEESVARAELL